MERRRRKKSSINLELKQFDRLGILDLSRNLKVDNSEIKHKLDNGRNGRNKT